MTSERSGRRLLALAGFSLLAAFFFSFTIDDSFIALRYGRNLAAGLGPIFDTQPAPREGFSSPLWIALSALPFLFHASPDAAVTFVKVAGALFGILTVMLAAGLARHGAAGVLVAAMPWVAFWSVSGLETSLYCALLTGTLVRHRREEERGSGHGGSGLMFGLLALTRPEGIAVALAALLNVKTREALRRAMPAVAVACGCWIAYEAWRIDFYGEWLPSTFAAKAGLTVHAIRTRIVELVPFALYVAPLVAAAAWFRGTAGEERKRAATRQGLGRAAWGAAIAQAAFAFVPRLEGAPGFRYELPLLPILAAAAVAAWAHNAPVRPPHAARAVLVALVVFLFTPMLWLTRPARYSSSAAEIAFGRWLAVNAPGARIAVYDLGAVPYYSNAPQVLDTNPAGPLSPFARGPYDLDTIVRWAPAFILLPPGSDPRDPLAALSDRRDFRAAYAPRMDLDAGDGYHVVVWGRR